MPVLSIEEQRRVAEAAALLTARLQPPLNGYLGAVDVFKGVEIEARVHTRGSATVDVALADVKNLMVCAPVRKHLQDAHGFQWQESKKIEDSYSHNSQQFRIHRLGHGGKRNLPGSDTDAEVLLMCTVRHKVLDLLRVHSVRLGLGLGLGLGFP
jgi:hypothetical protein